MLTNSPNPYQASDEELAEVLKLMKKANVDVHIRGTDEKPVVEVTQHLSTRIVGGIELRLRLLR